MSFRAWIVALAAAGTLSGCASLGLSQDLQRLQSQVALVDERLTQLERVSTRQPIAAGASQTTTRSQAVKPLQTAATAGAAEEKTSSEKPSEKIDGAESGTVQDQERAVQERTTVAVMPTTANIQQALKSAGLFKNEVDGQMGPATREAVREFQRLNGLQIDGIVGRKTWSKLSTHVDALASGQISGSDTVN